MIFSPLEIEKKILQIAEEKQTPAYVFFEDLLDRCYLSYKKAFREKFPNFLHLWSVKTNHLDTIISKMNSLGSGMEVVSLLEYEKVVGALNGIPEHFHVNGAGKTEHLLKRAIQDRSVIQIDSPDEIDRIAKLASKEMRARVALRILPDMAESWERFGVPVAEGAAWAAVKRIASEVSMDLVGIHCHLATSVHNSLSFSFSTKCVCDFVKAVESELGYQDLFLNLGGGFAGANKLKSDSDSSVLPDFETYAERIAQAYDAVFSERNRRIILETGRALIESSGFLVSRIVALKSLGNSVRNIVVDSGINHLNSAFGFRLKPLQSEDCEKRLTLITGSLAMNEDVLFGPAPFDCKNVGDFVIFPNIGAYNTSLSWQFSMVRPPVIWVDNGSKVWEIRSREQLLDISGKESLPDSLR